MPMRGPLRLGDIQCGTADRVLEPHHLRMIAIQRYHDLSRMAARRNARPALYFA